MATSSGVPFPTTHPATSFGGHGLRDSRARRRPRRAAAPASGSGRLSSDRNGLRGRLANFCNLLGIAGPRTGSSTSRSLMFRPPRQRNRQKSRSAKPLGVRTHATATAVSEWLCPGQFRGPWDGCELAASAAGARRLRQAIGALGWRGRLPRIGLLFDVRSSVAQT